MSFESSSTANNKSAILDMALASKFMRKEAPNELIIQGQQIDSLGDLVEISSLRKLDISFNHIKTLNGIEKLPQLRQLHAYCCRIQNIDNIASVPRLETLMLQQNGITNLVTSFTSLAKLRELRVDRNRLSSVDNLSCCTSLRMLDLSWNKISSLDGIAGHCTQFTSSRSCHHAMCRLRSCSIFCQHSCSHSSSLA